MREKKNEGKAEISRKRESEKENREVAKIKEKRMEPQEKKEREPAKRKGKTNMSFYAHESEVKRAFLEDQPMSFIVYKESSLNLTNLFLVWLFLCCRSPRMYFRRRC